MPKYKMQIIELRRVRVRVVAEGESVSDAVNNAIKGVTVSEETDNKNYSVDERYLDGNYAVASQPDEPAPAMTRADYKLQYYAGQAAAQRGSQPATPAEDPKYLVSLSELTALTRTICEEVWNNTVASTDFTDIIRTSLDGLAKAVEAQAISLPDDGADDDAFDNWSLPLPRKEISHWLQQQHSNEEIYNVLRLDEDVDPENPPLLHRRDYLWSVQMLLEQAARTAVTSTNQSSLKMLLECVKPFRKNDQSLHGQYKITKYHVEKNLRS